MTCRGGKLYSTGRDMLIKVWDTEDVTRGCIATLKGHTDVVCFIIRKPKLLSYHSYHSL
jgi:WD40 repeat protein